MLHVDDHVVVGSEVVDEGGLEGTGDQKSEAVAATSEARTTSGWRLSVEEGGERGRRPWVKSKYGDGNIFQIHFVYSFRDGTRRVWVRVEPPHTHPVSFSLTVTCIHTVNGYLFFPYPSTGRVNGYPWVKHTGVYNISN